MFSYEIEQAVQVIVRENSTELQLTRQELETIRSLIHGLLTGIIVGMAKVESPSLSPIEDVLCPDCGIKMVARSGQYGKFWGCKNYPKCKGTRDSEGRSKADREKERELRESKELASEEGFSFNRKKER